MTDSNSQPLLTRRSILVAGTLIPFWLGACSMLGKPEAATAPPATGGLFKASVASIGGELSAAEDLNPSESGRASPLPLRLFELRAATAFSKADFLALYQAELQTLGDELLAREELVLAPGETRTLKRVLNPETRFIGVFGAYRAFERAVWRDLAPVKPGKPHQLLVKASSRAISIRLQVL